MPWGLPDSLSTGEGRLHAWGQAKKVCGQSVTECLCWSVLSGVLMRKQHHRGTAQHTRARGDHWSRARPPLSLPAGSLLPCGTPCQRHVCIKGHPCVLSVAQLHYQLRGLASAASAAGVVGARPACVLVVVPQRQLCAVQSAAEVQHTPAGQFACKCCCWLLHPGGKLWGRQKRRCCRQQKGGCCGARLLWWWSLRVCMCV